MFIEGREVPFISAAISAREGAPVSATINLVPLKQIKFIKPRTQVHIFMQDTKNFPDNNFYLVFEGEVLGRAMMKRQDSRSFSVVAIDYSSYWDEAKSYVMNPNFVLGKVSDVVSFQDAPIDQVVKALGGKAFQTSATANTRIVEIMLAGGNKDLAKAVVAVINQLSSAGQFFKAAYERLRVTDRVNLFSGNHVQEFLKDMKIEEFLADFTGKFGGISSLRDMLYSVMAIVFHSFVSIPFPAYIPSTSNKSKKRISQFFFVPDGYSLPAPLCNVVFPNQQQGYSFQEDFRALPTRYSFRASMPLMTQQGITYPQYPTQFYPTGFSDYMFGKRTINATEKSSMLGPSELLTDPNSKNTYASIFYDKDKKTAVGTSFGNVLREADYLSNEESLKGIYLEMDTFMPGYTALAKNASPESRTKFIQAVGSYLFYKKRFSSRQVTAELIFHPFLVPGFNAIFLDDTEAGQSFIAKLQSVTHTLSNDGCATNVELAYGRDFDEVDALTGGSGEPPVPPWFDSNIFGQTSTALFKEETDYLFKLGAIDEVEREKRNKIVNPTVFPNLNTFYQALMGVNSTTNYNKQAGADPKKTPPLPKLVSTRGAVSWLLYQYRLVASDPDAREQKVRDLIYRPLVPLLDAFDFIRAEPVGFKAGGQFKLPDEFASFTAKTTGDLPGRFDGKGKYPDTKAIALRREIVDEYVQVLKTRVGFRG